MGRAQDSRQSEARKWCFGKQDLIVEKSLGKGEGGLESGSGFCWVSSDCHLEHSPPDPQNERSRPGDR